jgi:hypothetical protein
LGKNLHFRIKIIKTNKKLLTGKSTIENTDLITSPFLISLPGIFTTSQ